MRYIKLCLLFFKAAFQNELAFRFNFFINILNSILGLAGSIGGLFIVYTNKESLNGWSFIETLALLGVYLTIQALKDLFISPSLDKLAGMGGEIETGHFDFTLLKPIPAQFYISVRNWSVWSIFNIIIGLGILCLATFQLNIKYKPADLLVFIISLINSQVLIYSIMLILSSVAFWYRGTFLLWIWNDVMQTGRYPIGIYPGYIKLILTWIIPVGFIVTVPAEFLTGRANYSILLSGVVLAVILFILASLFFKKSLNKYTSASS